MSNFTIIRNKVHEQIVQGYTGFVIFPYGENGVLTKTVLKECFDIKDITLIDNELWKYNLNIRDVKWLIENKKFFLHKILLYTSYDRLIANELNSIKEEVKIIDLFDEIPNRLTEKIDVGKGSYGPLVRNWRVEKIGSFCSFASGCDAVWNHQLGMVTTHDFIFYASSRCKGIINQKYRMSDFNKKFVIGNDVWFGKNVILTNGVKIGNGVIAAAGAVITKDVPDYAIVAGVPARIIRYRFTREQIDKLNKIAWWNWTEEKIKNCYDDFMDIDIFLKKHFKESDENGM